MFSIAARRAVPALLRQPSVRAASTVGEAALVGIESRWARLPECEQAAVAERLHEAMKGDWRKMSLQEKKAGGMDGKRHRTGLTATSLLHRLRPALEPRARGPVAQQARVLVGGRHLCPLRRHLDVLEHPPWVRALAGPAAGPIRRIAADPLLASPDTVPSTMSPEGVAELKRIMDEDKWVAMGLEGHRPSCSALTQCSFSGPSLSSAACKRWMLDGDVEDGGGAWTGFRRTNTNNNMPLFRSTLSLVAF